MHVAIDCLIAVHRILHIQNSVIHFRKHKAEIWKFFPLLLFPDIFSSSTLLE